jgi:phospholipid/cholesterol/gamma-HCH transport system substrate-binding protein
MYSVTGAGLGNQKTYEVYGLFDDVSGLSPQTRVTVAGVKVGEVVSIGIDPNSPDLARVVIALKDDVEILGGELDNGVWTNGATLTRKSASLLGDMYLELTRGVRGEPLGDGDQIRQAISISGLGAVMKQLERSEHTFERISEIVDKVDGIAADVKSVTGAVRNILGGDAGEKQLSEIAENVRKASEDIRIVLTDVKAFTGDVRTFLGDSVLGRGDQIGRIVGNVERFTQNAATLSSNASVSASRILADVETVTGDVRRLIRGSANEVESSLGTIKGALAQFTQTMKTVDSSLGNIDSITRKIDQGEGTIGKLVNDDTLVRDVQEVVQDAGNLVKSVTGLQTRVELSSEFYVRQGALKNYLRLRLAPKEDKYYLIELIDDPRGKTVFQTQVTQTNDPNLPPVVHETTGTTEEGIKFSFQFAKRWYFLTGRFGVFEGTGGLGVDVEFFSDDLKFSLDLFDFSQDEAPRLRALANYEFFQHFYLSAGVDDVFNSQSFDWFMGFGIRFTDDDLKGLLTVAPIPSL